MKTLVKCVEGCGEPALGHEWPLNACSVCCYLVEILAAEAVLSVAELSAKHEASRLHRETVIARVADLLTRCGVTDGPHLIAEMERLTLAG